MGDRSPVALVCLEGNPILHRYTIAGESETEGGGLDPVVEPATEPRASEPPVTFTGWVSRVRLAPVALVARFDPGLAKMREAAVTMVATLASFATALVIEHVAQLSTSIVILAVALTLSIGRMGQRGDHRAARRVALAAVVLPLVAVGANEISTRMFRQPDLGDALFVVAMSTTIWLRRLGPAARQIATFATFPLVAALIVPAQIAANGSTTDGPWWSALIALVALGWATATRFVAERGGILVPAVTVPHPTRPVSSLAGTSRRIAPSTRMALQMAAALGAAFAAGRSLFGIHWTWVVLTAFIVSSGNRGRGEAMHKAAMRVVGAGVGTLAATALSGAFPPGDRWSIVIIFAVLAVALWLRSINYAYWAAGMTAALALLYGYYGQRGIGLLATRLEAILVGAALAVAASWFLLPVRTTDIIRRDIALALAALDDYLAGLQEDPSSAFERQDRLRHAVRALDHASAVQRAVPAPLRSRFDHLPALKALDRCAQEVTAVTAALVSRSPEPHGRERLDDLRAATSKLRRANAQRLALDPLVWDRLVDAIRELPRPLDSPTPPPPTQDRLWASSQQVIAYANRMHTTSYELVSEVSRNGTSLTYLVQDAFGQHAQLTWSRDTTLARIGPSEPVVETPPVELAAGRTTSGYPYQLTSTNLDVRCLGCGTVIEDKEGPAHERS